MVKTTYTFTCPDCGKSFSEGELGIREGRDGFYDYCDCGTKCFSPVVTVIEKASRKSDPSKANILIHPVGQTEKSYMVEDGTNNLVSHPKVYHSFIAKSVCRVDADGNVYAPYWATSQYIRNDA